MPIERRIRSAAGHELGSGFADDTGHPIEGIHPPDIQHVPEALENPGAKAAGEIPEGWILADGELSPEQVRGLGRFVYISMFENVADVIMNGLYAANRRQALDEDRAPERRPDLTGDDYINAFAKHHSTNLDVLLRWGDAASREIADSTLPRLHQRRADMDERGFEWALAFGGTKWADHAIAVTERVALYGIAADVYDHFDLVASARRLHVHSAPSGADLGNDQW